MAEKGYVPASVNGMAVYESIKMEDKRIIQEKQSFNSELDEELELQFLYELKKLKIY